jgi:acyl-CoA thioesterase I
MRHVQEGICSTVIVGTIALACLAGAANAPAAAAEAPCVAPADLVRLDVPLERTARQLASRKFTVIVALGSSSTAGSGASSAETTYPNRLMVELGHRFLTEPLMVLNRGIAGERAVDMLARFDDTVASEHPDLVLWQLGTNAVLRGYEHAKSDSVIREGIRRIKAIGADAVLIDPQYAPKVLAQSQASDMVDLISSRAAQEKIDVFHRFALMRYWHEQEGLPFETFLSTDGLHMNDWGHGCFAKALADAIADAAGSDQTSRKDDLQSEAATTGKAH